ncbi:MAG TPA: cupin domain-containing protein [Pseudomonas xinjiangensis]|uniref:Cupin domain-containing protein n=2 Tax=root TaxID=1 RepID=A0A7V1FRL2_9GAMM|nr:cupin domain-containing protein [Halopseudomonas xinjiangensis]HEC46092.1 cupin domain-containing protein [Halopseudomonas xinjiangensis]
MSITHIVDFASATTEAEHYRPDPAKVLAGDPAQNVRNHYSSPCNQFSAGEWACEPGQWAVSYSEHEYCEILEGESILRDSSGNARTLRTGDRFVIPAGFEGTWEVIERTRKVYVIFESSQ